MFNPLAEDQIDRLQRYLIVPLAVADIIRHDLDVEPEMQYGLHMALSEIDPDSALLAIALCARDLSEKLSSEIHIASALQKEANSIIGEYGATWLRYHENGPMPSKVFQGLLQTVPEDLEALADLMDAVASDLDEINRTSLIALCNLLSIQARAHMEIAEYILAEIERDQRSGEGTPMGDGGMAGDEIDLDAHRGTNIILFPGNIRH